MAPYPPPPGPDDDRDLLAASILDGETPWPDDASDELRDRVRRFEEASAALAATPPFPDAERRDAQIAAAVSAAGDRVVVPLRRRPRWTSTPVLAGAVAAAAAVLVLAVGVLGDLGSDETDVAGVQVSATTAESAEDEQPAMTTMATAATTAALETNTAAAMDEEGSYADAARVEQAESALAGSDAYLAEPADGPTVDLLPADDSLDVEAWARDDLGTDLDGTPCPVDAMADLLGQPVLAAGPLDPDAPDGLWVYAGADRRLVADSVDCSWVYLTEPPDPDGP